MASGFLKEFFEFLMTRKKWWLLPIIIAFLLIGLLMIFAGSNAAVAPFIYTLF